MGGYADISLLAGKGGVGNVSDGATESLCVGALLTIADTLTRGISILPISSFAFSLRVLAQGASQRRLFLSAVRSPVEKAFSAPEGT